jgi:hypothetical protein
MLEGEKMTEKKDVKMYRKKKDGVRGRNWRFVHIIIQTWKSNHQV